MVVSFYRVYSKNIKSKNYIFPAWKFNSARKHSPIMEFDCLYKTLFQKTVGLAQVN